MSLDDQNKVTILQAAIPLRDFLYRLSLLLLILFALFIVVLNKSENKYLESLRIKILDFVSPAISVISSPAVAYNKFKDSMGDVIFVYEKNKMLVQENKKLKYLRDISVDLHVENARLREMLKFIPQPDSSFVSARVVGDMRGSYLMSASIDAGKNNGVKKSQIVINLQGLVGRIKSVGNKSARIMLITDINSRVPVISQKTRERAMLLGNNSNLLEMLHLPEDSNISVGEKIITSGDGKFFPPEVEVGYVYSVTKNKILVKPLVDFNRLDYVTITEYNPQETEETKEVEAKKIKENGAK